MVRPKRKRVEETLTVNDALEKALSDLQQLSDEMDSWRSNMEGTNLEYTMKYEQVSECADILMEQASNLEDVKDEIQSLEEINLDEFIHVVFLKPYSRYESRQTRLDRVLAYLHGVKDELEAEKDTLEEKVDELEEIEEQTKEQTEQMEKLESVVDTLQDCLNELEDIVTELEYVDFPTMY